LWYTDTVLVVLDHMDKRKPHAYESVSEVCEELIASLDTPWSHSDSIESS
jgi:hypothetical protein